MREDIGAVAADKEARKRTKILVVEDNEDNRRILLLRLRHWGALDIHEATTGHAALDYLQQELPGMVL
jgi:CheY-like chemotaxis protein